MSINCSMPHHHQCLCSHASLYVRLCKCTSMYMCVCVYGSEGVVCAYIHPPTPEAVLCIVVGMAYMLIQAWSSVVQYTRLSIPTALPCRVCRPASFTFAPELMLVNCHISSDLLTLLCQQHKVASECDSCSYFCFNTQIAHELTQCVQAS